MSARPDPVDANGSPVEHYDENGAANPAWIRASADLERDPELDAAIDELQSLIDLRRAIPRTQATCEQFDDELTLRQVKTLVRVLGKRCLRVTPNGVEVEE